MLQNMRDEIEQRKCQKKQEGRERKERLVEQEQEIQAKEHEMKILEL